MSDRLLYETERSLARFLDTSISGVTAYIVTPDFDWDKNPDESNRELPFVAVRFDNEDVFPAFMDSDLTHDPAMNFSIINCSDTYSSMRQRMGEVKQKLQQATAIASGVNFYFEDYPGLPLLDSSDNWREVGVLEVEFNTGSADIVPNDIGSWQNLKFASVTNITLTPIYKQTSKDLL